MSDLKVRTKRVYVREPGIQTDSEPKDFDILFLILFGNHHNELPGYPMIYILRIV